MSEGVPLTLGPLSDCLQCEGHRVGWRGVGGEGVLGLEGGQVGVLPLGTTTTCSAVRVCVCVCVCVT